MSGHADHITISYSCSGEARRAALLLVIPMRTTTAAAMHADVNQTVHLGSNRLGSAGSDLVTLKDRRLKNG